MEKDLLEKDVNEYITDLVVENESLKKKIKNLSNESDKETRFSDIIRSAKTKL